MIDEKHCSSGLTNLTLHPIVAIGLISTLHWHKCLGLCIGNEGLSPNVHAGKLAVETGAPWRVYRGPIRIGSHHLDSQSG